MNLLSLMYLVILVKCLEKWRCVKQVYLTLLTLLSWVSFVIIVELIQHKQKIVDRLKKKDVQLPWMLNQMWT